MSITSSFHPDYLAEVDNCYKYRLIMEGGDTFIEEYLVKFSDRETKKDFRRRKLITPTASFAKSAIIDVKNSIFQRMADIQRIGGSSDYQSIIKGEKGGVDRAGSSMSYFIGMEVLPELLFLGKVGVYVDMPELSQNTLAETRNKIPYFYSFHREDILNWHYDFNINNEYVLTKLLLRQHYHEYDDYGLPKGLKEQYRLFTLLYDGVHVVTFDNTGTLVYETILNLPFIPFTIFELDSPLTQEIANHQIALLNLGSSDISYTLTANYPFYTEQQGMSHASHLKGAEDGENGQEIEAGGTVGRAYGKGLERPQFIHPSSEPLQASMEKQDKLKDDVRSLINLALSNVNTKFSSAESKELDERGLESGLSAIGLVLEQGERELATVFHAYEGSTDLPKIVYPTRYNLKKESDRLDEVEKLGKQRDSIPSKKLQKIISKKMASTLVGAEVPVSELNEILDEIEKAPFISSEAESIHSDIEKGLVSLKTAAVARGYNENEPELAAKDHAARIARIQASQTPDAGARGIDDLKINPDDANLEKKNSQNPDLDDTGKTRTRGEA